MKNPRLFISLLMVFMTTMCINAQSFGDTFETSPEPADGNFTNGTKWYMMKFTKNSGYYITTSTWDGTGFKFLNAGTPTTTDYRAQWCFVGNSSDGYKIYNRDSGTTKCLGFSGVHTGSGGGTYTLQILDNTAANSDQTIFLHTNNQLALKASNGHQAMNPWSGDSDYIRHWQVVDASGGDNRIQFAIVDVESVNIDNITLNYINTTKGGEIVDTEEIASAAVDLSPSTLATKVPSSCVIDHCEPATITEGVTVYNIYYHANYTPTGANATVANSQRYTNKVMLTTINSTEEINTGQSSTGKKVWNDCTNTATYGKFTCNVGEPITASINFVGEWMHAYCYIDEDYNGFSVNEAEDITGQHKLRTGADCDLKSFSYRSGYNSIGESVAAGNKTITMPTFTAPSTPGTYRVRYKVDWDNTDPNGASGIGTNGGLICDVMLDVTTTSNFEVSESELHLKYGESVQLTYVVPDGETVTWTTSDAAVATVSTEGMVTACTSRGSGTCTITGTCKGIEKTVTVYYLSYGYSKSNGNEPSSERYLTSVTTTGAKTNLNYTGGTYPGATHYKDATAYSMEVQPGKTVNLTFIGADTTDGIKYTKGKAWIDWNCDGEFDEENEMAFEYGTANNKTDDFTTGHLCSFTIPVTATVGNSRMRMVFANAWEAGQATVHPTGLTEKGFSIDFSVVIAEPEGIDEITLVFTDENNIVTNHTIQHAAIGGAISDFANTVDGYAINSCTPATVTLGTTEYTVSCTRKLTFTYRDELGNTFGGDVVSGGDHLAGTDIPTTFDYYTLDGTTPTVNTTDRDYIIQLRNDFPFNVCQPPTDDEINANQFDPSINVAEWYLINTVDNGLTGNDNIPMKYVTDDNSNYDIRTKETTAQLNEKYMWCFVKVNGTENQFQLYNLQRGPRFTLGVLGTAENSGSGANNYRATFNNMSAECDCFKIIKGDGYFLMQHPTNTNKTLGRHAGEGSTDGGNTYLGFWNNANSANDKGSRFQVTPVDDIADITLDNEYTDDYVGAYRQTDIDLFIEKKAAYNSNKTIEQLREMITASNPTRNEINTQKYYQIVSYNDVNCVGQAIYSNAFCDKNGSNSQYGDRGLLIAKNPNVPASAVQFVADGQDYDIRHANSNYWYVNLNALNDMTQADLPIYQPGNDVKYIIQNERNKPFVWSLRCNNNENKFLHCGTGNGMVICRQDSPLTNDGNLWLIHEIHEVPIDVSAAKWATLCLPMPLRLKDEAQNENCKLYYVANNGDINNMYITLTEFDEDVIPTGTPLFVCNEGASSTATFTFEVLDDNATNNTPYSGNLLSGSTARRYGFTSEELYGLSNIDGVVGLRLSTSTYVPANKAYLLKSVVQAATGTMDAPALVFRFGGTATEIGSIENAMEETDEFYNLNGIRVYNPQHGVFVRKDGRKVFIK